MHLKNECSAIGCSPYDSILTIISIYGYLMRGLLINSEQEYVSLKIALLIKKKKNAK